MNTSQKQQSSKRDAAESKPGKLVMFSTRLEESLCESVRDMAHTLRRSRQDIVGEALELFRAKYGEVSPAADTGKQ